jgi:hypothetical protein
VCGCPVRPTAEYESVRIESTGKFGLNTNSALVPRDKFHYPATDSNVASKTSCGKRILS